MPLGGGGGVKFSNVFYVFASLPLFISDLYHDE